jgi:hypothetical protein
MNLQLPKKLTVIAIVTIMIIFSVTMAVVLATPTVHGEIRAEICTPFDNSLMSRLGGLIQDAQILYNTTHEAESGANIPTDEWWATPQTHEIFRIAIANAQAVYEAHETVIGAFSPGEEFNISLTAESDAVIAAMMLRLGIPAGLELVGFERHIDIGDAVFVGAEYWDEQTNIVYPPMTRNIFTGWTNADISTSGNLFTYTFRVIENAPIGITEPITFAFANALNYNSPVDPNDTSLNITLPGVQSDTDSYVWDFGRILITEPEETFAPGETFTVTLPMHSETNAAAMMVRLEIPPYLELIGFEPHINVTDEAVFVAPEDWDSETNDITPPIIGNAFAFAGWTYGDVPLNGNVFTYTFRVCENATPGTTTEPITFTFANALYNDPPIGTNGLPLDITLPASRKIIIR